MPAAATKRGYRATKNEDGTVTVHDVPVFAEAVDARGKKVVVYDRKKLAALLAIARREEQEGYLPPLHFRHHYDPDVKRAGAFRITRMGLLRLNGADRWTLFADLIVDAAAYAEIQAGRWPYRSVELTPQLDRIRGLALLDHEAPFHRFELLRVREAFAEGSRGYALCFAEEVRPMDDEDKKDDEKPADMADDPEEGEGEGEKKPANMAEGGAAPDIGALVAAALAKALAPIYEKLGIGGADMPTENPAEQDMPAEAPAAASDRGDTDVRRELRQLRGQVVAFSDALKRSERARRVDARAAKLLADGAGESVVKRFRQLAEKDEAAANAFADAAVELIPPAPVPWSDLGGSGSGSAGRVGDPEEVAAYSDQGPETLARARKVAQTWARNRKAGLTKHTLADYLRANVDGFASAITE